MSLEKEETLSNPDNCATYSYHTQNSGHCESLWKQIGGNEVITVKTPCDMMFFAYCWAYCGYEYVKVPEPATQQ